MSVSRTVSAHWSALTDYTRNKETLTNLIQAPLDRTLRAAQQNMSAQAFIIDDTGILGRKYDRESDESDGTFLPQQIRIINNTILFTDDNWEHASLALGNVTVNEDGDTAYGLVADTLVGKLILGENMIIGSDDGKVIINNNGIAILNANQEKVFNADKNGNAYFRGKVYATEGEFTGTIKAETGEIAGLIISKQDIIGENGVITETIKKLSNDKDTFHIRVSENENTTGTEVLITDLLCDEIKANNSTNKIDLCYQGQSAEVTATLSFYQYPPRPSLFDGYYACDVDFIINIDKELLSPRKITVYWGIGDRNSLLSSPSSFTVTIPKETVGNYAHKEFFTFSPLVENYRVGYAYFSESGQETLNFTTAKAENTMIGIEGNVIPLNDAYSFGTEDYKWFNGYFQNFYIGENLYVGGQKVIAPYIDNKSDISVYVGDNNSPANSETWTYTGKKAQQTKWHLGGLSIICFTFDGEVQQDKWYRIESDDLMSIIYSMQVTSRATYNTSLSGNSHAGNLTAFVQFNRLYVGCDTYSNKDGFYAQIICGI